MNELQKLKASLRDSPPLDQAMPSDLEPLIAHLRQNGMGRQVDSWIGDGPNEAADPAELERALAAPAVGQPVPLGGGILGTILGGLLNGGMGGRAAPAPRPSGGLGGGSSGGLGSLGGGLLGGLLAQALPYIINAMTPHGRIDDRDAPSGGLGSIIESITKGGGRMAPRDNGGLPDTGAGGDLSGMLGRGLNPR